MSVNNYFTLSGQELVSLLSVTKAEIKWIDDCRVIGHLSSERAVLVAKSGNFVGKCKSGRVISIREVESRALTVDSSYWDDRACGLYRWPNTPVSIRDVEAWSRSASTTSRLE